MDGSKIKKYIIIIKEVKPFYLFKKCGKTACVNEEVCEKFKKKIILIMKDYNKEMHLMWIKLDFF